MGSFQKNLIAHELAHQWFGDYITCASWNEIWLNEGFASYLEALTFEEFSPDSWQQWKDYTRKILMSEPDGAVYCNDVDNIDRIFDSRLSYDKGSYVLHMLRGQLGDTPFFDGMRRYLTDPRVTNGLLLPICFVKQEKAAGISLAEFFNDWVYGEGYPVYDIQYTYFSDRLEITVNQSPSLTGGPFFEMKLPLYPRYAGARYDLVAR
jgi:aminopeptidase N